MKNRHKEERKIQAKKLTVNKKRICLESIGFRTPFIKGLQDSFSRLQHWHNITWQFGMTQVILGNIKKPIGHKQQDNVTGDDLLTIRFAQAAPVCHHESPLSKIIHYLYIPKSHLPNKEYNTRQGQHFPYAFPRKLDRI